VRILQVMRDEATKKSRGFGFVCYSSPDEATHAVNQMNRTMFMGKRLYVALALRKEVGSYELLGKLQHKFTFSPCAFACVGRREAVCKAV